MAQCHANQLCTRRLAPQPSRWGRMHTEWQAVKSLFLRKFVPEAELEGGGGLGDGAIGVVPDDEGVVVGA